MADDFPALSALTVAKYFLSLTSEEDGDLISNMKLQKLLYYAQGCWVALHGAESPLFREKILAWRHGPVVKSVYQHYAGAGANALPAEQRPRVDREMADFLDEIYRVFGKFSAWKLREMTHREKPWLDVYQPERLDVEITTEALQRYFKKYVRKA